MQLSALKYFLETARRGSIRKAADSLHVVPSAISRQIALLEAQFGAVLIERGKTGIRLTSAGQVLLAQARSVLADIDRAKVEIDDLQHLRRGVVRIASIEGAVTGLVLPAIERYSKAYPGVSFDVRVAGAVPVLQLLAKEECDVAITFEPEPNLAIAESSSFHDPVMAVMSPTHPLARRRKVRLSELAAHKLALLDHTHTTRVLIDAAAAAEGISLEVLININQGNLALACAKQGTAVTCLPWHVIRRDVNARLVRAALIEHPRLKRTRTALCLRRSREPIRPVQVLVDELKAEFSAAALDLRQIGLARKR